MTEDKNHIQGNIYVVYSPDENLYYLEDRNPDNWRVSTRIWNSRIAAIDAFYNDVIVWESV